MNKSSIFGVGSALLDYHFMVPSTFLPTLGLRFEDTALASEDEQNARLEALHGAGYAPNIRACGGSTVNALSVVAAAGLHAICASRLGKDSDGREFLADLKELGIEDATLTRQNAATGNCLVLTHDGQWRTMSTSLGASATLDAELISTSNIERSDWLLLEGYSLANASGVAMVETGIDRANAAGVPVALSLSAQGMIEIFRSAYERVLNKHIALLVGDYAEWCCLLQTDPGASHEEICALAGDRFPAAALAITHGDKGVHYRAAESEWRFRKALEVDTVDSGVGAGDAFLGGVIAGLVLTSNDIDRAIALGNALGAATVGHTSARLPASEVQKCVQEFLDC